MWVSCPTCHIFAHIPNNKNTKEKCFAFPICLVKWTYPPVSLHLLVLSPSSLPQAQLLSHPLDGTSVTLAHPQSHRSHNLSSTCNPFLTRPPRDLWRGRCHHITPFLRIFWKVLGQDNSVSLSKHEPSTAHFFKSISYHKQLTCDSTLNIRETCLVSSVWCWWFCWQGSSTTAWLARSFHQLSSPPKMVFFCCFLCPTLAKLIISSSGL